MDELEIRGFGCHVSHDGGFGINDVADAATTERLLRESPLGSL